MNRKHVVFALIYGVVFINILDLSVNGSQIPLYHVGLVGLYFLPFLPLLFNKPIRPFIVLGLLVSLMNDLFYGPVGVLFGLRSYDLLDWYSFQLGFQCEISHWFLNFGFFTVPVTSWLMGSSVALRVFLLR